MRERKHHLYLIADEYNIIIRSLIDLRNRLIEQGKYTDAVDELLVKVSKAKKKKLSFWQHY